MGTSAKHLKKCAIKIEGTAGSYEAPDILLPFTSLSIKQEYGLIEDEGIVGVAFKDLPVQGIKKVTGSIGSDVDVNTIEAVLQAGMGYVSSHVFSCPADKNEKSLSICTLDEVKTNKYAGVYLNNLNISSQAEQAVKFTADIIGWKAETRDGTSFPTINTNAGTKLLHQHAYAGSGYFRIADQADALAAGDNVDLEQISVGINWKFDFQFMNSQLSLVPLSCMSGRPDAAFSFRIPRHTADTYKAWKDARTALQATLLYYGAAAAQMKIEISNFIISEVTDTDDDITREEVTCILGRNGTGTSYSNANMSFVTPVRITITNA